MLKGMSTLLAGIERDDALVELQTNLTEEFKDGKPTGGEVYKRIVRGVIAVLSKIDAPDAAVELNAECLVMLEDIATYGRPNYPWKLVKMCLVVVWGHLFDEVYDNEVATAGCKYDKQEFDDEKRRCLALLMKLKHPPITLQRIAEILLKQPYRSIGKLFHAYRKVVSVGSMMADDDSASPSDEELEDSESMHAALKSLRAWETDIVDADDPVCEGDIWLEDSDDNPVVTETAGALKRPLDPFC